MFIDQPCIIKETWKEHEAISNLFINKLCSGVPQDGSGPNSEVQYSIEHRWPDTPDLLTLDPSTGVLTLGQSLDRETTPSLYLVVRATDSASDPAQRRWGSVTARQIGRAHV